MDNEMAKALLALYTLIDGNVNDSVPQTQLEVEISEVERTQIDKTVEWLVRNGLAERIFISEGVTWLGVTARGAQIARLNSSETQ